MADSPAKRHLQRVEAEQAAKRAAGGNLMEGTPIYQQTLLQLATDRARLKQIQSSKAKGQLKAALLPTYDAYIEGVLAADAGGQDDVVSTLMLWNIDAGLYDAALDIAAYVLAHGLTMPDRFERTAGCVVAEEIGIAALNALKTGAAFDLGVLNRAVEVTKGHDMPDQVRARLLLARARCLLPPAAKRHRRTQRTLVRRSRICAKPSDCMTAAAARKTSSAPSVCRRSSRPVSPTIDLTPSVPRNPAGSGPITKTSLPWCDAPTTGDLRGHHEQLCCQRITRRQATQRHRRHVLARDRRGCAA